MKKKILAMMIVMATVFVMTSCGGKNSLVGVWKNNKGSYFNSYKTIEFYDDGTIVSGGDSGRYETTEDFITVLDLGIMGTNFKWQYELDGDSLTLTWEDDGDVMEFTRVDE